MFRLFSVMWEPIAMRQAELVVSGTLQADVRTTWEALELPGDVLDAFEEALSPYVGRDAHEVMHELRREETRLFLTPKALVSNTEGVWRKKAEGYQIVAFMINSYSIEVADFMRQCGVVKAQGKNECIDYVHNECEFAAILADNPEYLVKLGKDPLSLLDEFIEKHLSLWISGFCEDVLRETKCPYYAAAARLLASFEQELEKD